MMIFEEEEAFAKELESVLHTKNVNLIGIDGKDGAGKSTVARKLGELLGMSLISLDDFVVKKRGSYVLFLPAEKIHERVSALSGPVIIEGVCLLNAAERIGLRIDILVYVKRMSAYGGWRDSEECNPSIPAEDLILKLESDLKAFSAFEAIWKDQDEEENSAEIRLPDLEKEIVRYHAEYRPAQNADYEFRRVEA